MLLLCTTVSAQGLFVTEVIDGDTYLLSDGQKVRLIGVDTPESFHSYKLNRDAERSQQDRAVIQALGSLAARYAESIVLDKRVTLSFDQSNAATGHKDRFGRTLAYVNIATENDLPLYCVNDRLIFDGFANAYIKYPFGRADWYAEAERTAREEERGLWATSVFETPIAKRLLDVQEELFITKSGARYHRPQCRSLRHSKIPFHADDDPEHRLTPCKICKPNPRG